MQAKFAPLFLSLIIALSLLSGCGGGGSISAANSSNTNRGAILFTVRWPASSRQKSASSRAATPEFNSVKITLAASGQKVAEQTVSRPPAGQTTTTTNFGNLPSGDLTLTASAFASTDGSGTAIASGSRALTVAAGQTAQSALSTGTPPANILVVPFATTTEIGGTVTLTASAVDGNGDLVILPASTWRWSSSNTAVATVAGTSEKATVSGVAAGSVTITVKLTDFGLDTVATVGVEPKAAYTLTDLGTLPGGDNFVPLGINDAGTVVGKYVNESNIPGGFLWKNGKMQVAVEISGIGKDNLSYGFLYAINNAEQTAGWFTQNGLVGVLLPPGFGGGPGAATAINDSGQTVGVLETSSPYEPTLALLWSLGKPRQSLPPLNNSLYSRANGINNQGQIVGASENGVLLENQNGQQVRRRNLDSRAVLWQNGQVTDIAPGLANAINAQGQVVGAERIGPPDPGGNETYRAFLWQNGQKTDLGPGAAFAINNKGQIVGMDGKVATLWQNGQATDLNTQISAHAQWILKTATGINANGLIVGSGFFGGHLRAFLLTPRP